jgi:hypothetical protein
LRRNTVVIASSSAELLLAMAANLAKCSAAAELGEQLVEVRYSPDPELGARARPHRRIAVAAGDRATSTTGESQGRLYLLCR